MHHPGRPANLIFYSCLYYSKIIDKIKGVKEGMAVEMPEIVKIEETNQTNIYFMNMLTLFAALAIWKAL